MKKLVLLTALLSALSLAQAVEVGVVGFGESPTGNRHPTDGGGLTIGEHFGAVSVTAEADRSSRDNMDKFSLIGGYDITKLRTATLTAKAGVTYLYDKPINQGERYVGVAGAGITVPVTKQVGLTVDYRYQKGGVDVQRFDGNTVLVGAKYSF